MCNFLIKFPPHLLLFVSVNSQKRVLRDWLCYSLRHSDIPFLATFLYSQAVTVSHQVFSSDHPHSTRLASPREKRASQKLSLQLFQSVRTAPFFRHQFDTIKTPTSHNKHVHYPLGRYDASCQHREPRLRSSRRSPLYKMYQGDSIENINVVLLLSIQCYRLSSYSNFLLCLHLRRSPSSLRSLLPNKCKWAPRSMHFMPKYPNGYMKKS
jgi:hypothetical protein